MNTLKLPPSPSDKERREFYIQRAMKLVHTQQQSSEYSTEMFQVLTNLLKRLDGQEEEALAWLIQSNCATLPPSVIYSQRVHSSAS